MMRVDKILKGLTLCVAAVLLISGCDKPVEKAATKSKLDLSTTPTGAEIFYKGKSIGNTPYVNEAVKPGFKLIGLKMKGYKTKWIQFTAKAGSSHTINEKLEPVRSSVMITSNPTRSSVVIDGDILGETPLVLHDLPFGEYKAQVNAQGYSGKTISWSITSSRPQKVDVDLDSNTGIIEVASSPEGATILIDNKPYGVTPGREEVEEGEHLIKIFKEGYESYEQSINLARGSVKQIGANLKIKPSSITVKTKPEGAEVFVNGDAYSSSPTTIKNLPAGDYVIMVRKQGFDDEVREISLAPGQQAETSINMGTNLGGIDLVVNPPGVTIYLDGKKMGFSKEDKNGASKVFQLRGLTSGRHKLRFSHKRATPQNLNMTISVSKGEISRPKKIKMWIADTIMTLKNGRVLKGRLILKNDLEVIFSETPKITMGYKPEEVKSLEPLEYEE